MRCDWNDSILSITKQGGRETAFNKLKIHITGALAQC
jgi:hypothetical protein